jgi:hypothetical protein
LEVADRVAGRVLTSGGEY